MHQIFADLCPFGSFCKLFEKVYRKNFLLHFFFFSFLVVLLLFGPILKYRKYKSAKGSYALII